MYLLHLFQECHIFFKEPDFWPEEHIFELDTATFPSSKYRIWFAVLLLYIYTGRHLEAELRAHHAPEVSVF